MSDQEVSNPARPMPVIDSAALVEFFGSAHALIVDLSASSRPVLRRMLSEVGVKTHQVHVAEGYEEALAIIVAEKPVIVFADYKLGAKSALDLFAEYTKLVPNRLGSVFVVISADNSPVAVTALADADVDVVLVRPLTAKDINEKFVESAAIKAKPTHYVKTIEAGRRFLEAGKHEQALRAFTGAQGLDPKPAMACYMEGKAYWSVGEMDSAFFAFKRGLTHEPKHYRCLVGVFELLCEQKNYSEAYEAGIAMLDHYPIHPKRIPEMIRLCIFNEKFEELLRFSENALELNLSDANVARYVTAGLFICGKHLLKKGQKEDALKVLRKTEVLSRSKPKIISEIIATLYTSGMIADAEEMLRRAPVEATSSPDVRLAILEYLHTQGIDAKTLHLSRELIHDEVSTPRLFEIALIQAKGLNRPDGVIQDLLLRGLSAFPDRRALYEALAADKPAQQAAS